MFGLLLSASLMVWIIANCIVFIKPERIQLKMTAEHSVNIIAFFLLVLTVYLLYLAHKNKEDLYGNFATSIGSIAVTVILIDRLNARRALEQRKQEIFEEIESRVRDVAVEAVRLVRKYVWLDEALRKVNLQNSQLAGVDFSYTQLVGVNLSRANLQGANLYEANLQEANLYGANLQQANLSGADLQDAKYDHRTIWPEGFLLNMAGVKLVS